MATKPSIDSLAIGRFLTIELARATELAAVAAAQFRGRGDEMAAGEAALVAMRSHLTLLPAHGRVVIGEGASASAFYFGEIIGSPGAPNVDLAVAPLEGATLCVKDMAGSISIAAAATPNALLNVPEVYMDKIAIGPGYPPGVVDLDRPPQENIKSLAKAKGVAPSEINICILDRPRHTELIAACRAAGARIRLISDGDVAGVIVAAAPSETGVDLYLGRGGAPEGVLAAAVLACVGGQMQGRLVLENNDQRARAAAHGISDSSRTYNISDMVSGDVVVCVTGVTDGPLARGVIIDKDYIETDTLAYRSSTGTVRNIRARRRATR
jgi:fructose-1,6-bisphosphatase II / sedoheptulose-1,7-bisphosphatase